MFIGDTMNKNKKIIVLLIFLVILTSSLTIIFSNTILVDIKLDGIHVKSHTLSIPGIHENRNQMDTEIAEYVSDEMYEDNSTSDSIKTGIKTICSKYGYSDIWINIKSEFGEDKLPIHYTVEGTSMLPTFEDGESVIVEKTRNISPGDCVVANTDEYGRVIKRVNQSNGSMYYIVSDNTNVSYTTVNGVLYKEEGIKTWVNQSDIVGIVRIHNVTNQTHFDI